MNLAPADRQRLAIFALAGVAAIAVGFVFVPPQLAQTLIKHGGYYYMSGLFALFVWCAARLIRQSWQAGWRPAFGLPAAVVVAGGVFAVWADPFGHKVLFDEYVLQGTAFHMHATKEVGTIIRAYDIQGTWLPIDIFLDKRPYFFTYLLSLVHDVIGFRIANVYALNVALVPICLSLFYGVASALAGRGPAMLAVALLATLPLLAQQATGAGMELHNLTMLLAVAWIAVLYLRAPDERRVSLLIVATILLAQSRYESVIFVVPVAAIIVMGWRQAGRVILPWIGVAAPLLLVPYAWHNRVVSNTPLLWQLQEGQSARFGLEYLPGNLEGAWRFFFNVGTALPNSWYLSALGAAAIGVMLVRARRWSRSRPRPPLRPELVAVGVFSTAIVANFVLLMFYYWSRLDDIVASRFALPMCALLGLLVAVMLRSFAARPWPVMRVAVAGLGVWLLVSGLPAIARRTYTAENLVMQELEWEHEQLLQRGRSLLFISNKSTIPFVLWKIPTIIMGVGKLRAPQIAYHLKEGTFQEVIVAQALRPTTPQGDLGVAPEDKLPPAYRLEPLAEKRFGARWARLSRLVAIDPLWLEEPALDASSRAAPDRAQ